MGRGLLVERIDGLILEHLHKIEQLRDARKAVVSTCKHNFNIKTDDGDKCSKCGHVNRGEH